MEYEFILIGIGLNDGTVSKGHICNDLPAGETCPKGVPSLKYEDSSPYAHDGYIKIQGPAQPLILGGRRFADEKSAMDWLAETDNRFKSIFMNIFLARVVK